MKAANDMTPRDDGPSSNRTVLAIGLASLFSDIGHETATTALPLLMASIGAGAAALGLIEGLADGLSSFAKLISGFKIDGLSRRKPLAVAGYAVTAIATASLGLAASRTDVLVSRVVGWLGRGARTPVRKVLLSEAVTPATYGRAFGFERAMDSVGAVIGPLLALSLVTVVGLRWTFALTIVPSLLPVLLIAWLVREKAHPVRLDSRASANLASLPGEFRKYLAGVAVAGLGDFSNTLLILWATQAWTPRFGAAHAASLAMVFYVGYNIVYSASSYIHGMLADHFSKNRVLAAGYSLAVIPAAALVMPGDSMLKFAIAFGFSGLYMGAWETLESATAATLLPSAVRGTGFGVLDAVSGVGDFVSSSVVGLLWTLKPAAAMTFVGTSALIGAAVIATVRPLPPSISHSIVQDQS